MNLTNMKKHHTEEQILGILKAAEVRKPSPDLFRQHGFPAARFIVGKAVRAAGTKPAAAIEAAGAAEHGTEEDRGRLGARRPDAEGRELKKLVEPVTLRDAVDSLKESYPVSRTPMCGLLHLAVSYYYYQSHGRRNEALSVRTALRRHAPVRRRWGYRRLLVLLKEDITDNHKWVYRLYRAEGLQVRQRRTASNGWSAASKRWPCCNGRRNV